MTLISYLLLLLFSLANFHYLHCLRIPINPSLFSNAYKLSSRTFLSLKAVDDKNIDWSFIDGVYLITTTQKENLRLEKTKSELESVGLWDRVKVRFFEPDDEDRVRGCYTSHISVLQEIQKECKACPNYKVLVLEDNIEKTIQMKPSIVEAVKGFLSETKLPWDIFHLAYMMYVPGLGVSKLASEEAGDRKWSKNIVRIKSEAGSSLGTSAYLVSKPGVEAILNKHDKQGYKEAIPNIMAALFPNSRFAAYPMIFHRAAKIGSLVNPQLDNFRKVMFSPIMYTTWESLLVFTGLKTNQLFPTLLISLLITVLSAIYGIFTNALSSQQDFSSSADSLITLIIATAPLGIGLWGASLFKSDNTGRGFAPSAQKKT